MTQPPSAKTQCATGTYTASVHSGTKTTHAPNRLRSANAPVMRAGVIAANISWNAANRRKGIVVA